MIAPAPAEPPFTRRSLAGFAVLLAVCLPLALVRASWGVSFWVDEVFSYILARRSVQFITGVTTFDAHPPLYYFILHYWLLVGDGLGVPPSALWARLPSVVGHVLSLGVLWFGGRWLLGAGAGTLAAATWGISSQALYIAKEMRNYSLAAAALLVVFVALLVAWRLARANRLGGRRAAVLWGVYAAGVSLALWLHLLSAFVLLFVGIAWVGMVAAGGWRHRGFLWGGFAGNALAVISFVPWLLVVRYQLEYLGNAPTPWMTDASFTHLLHVYTLWYPFGRVGFWDAAVVFSPWFAFGWLCLVPVLVPLAVAAKAGREAGNDRVFEAGLVAALAAFLMVAATWGATNAGLARIFHGPRYPVLAFPLFVFGMVALTDWARRRLGAGPWLGWLLMGPYLLAGVMGYRFALHSENEFPRERISKVATADFPPSEGVIYVFPPVLTPLYRPLLPEHGLVPGGHLLEADPFPDPVRLMTMGYWTQLPGPVHRYLAMLSTGEGLGREMQRGAYPTDYGWFVIHEFSGIHQEAVERLRMLTARSRGEWPEELRERFAGAVALALPETQQRTDGFHLLEINLEGYPYIWGGRETTRLRFDEAIEAGRYRLRVQLMRHPYPAEEVEMSFRFAGQRDVYTETVGAGHHLVAFEVEVDRRLPSPVLDVTHPAWRPNAFIEGSRDPRELTFLFSAAWLEPVGEP